MIKPVDYDIPYESEKVHGISTELAKQDGVDLSDVIDKFLFDLDKAKYLVGHNVKFDINIIAAELYRLGIVSKFSDLKVIDTCTETTANLCKIKGGRAGKFKYPTLIELYDFLFNDSFDQAHNASADVEATARSFLELIRSNILSNIDFENFEKINNALKEENKSKVPLFGLKHINLKEASSKLKVNKKPESQETSKSSSSKSINIPYIHLHNNSII